MELGKFASQKEKKAFALQAHAAPSGNATINYTLSFSTEIMASVYIDVEMFAVKSECL